MVSLVSYHCVFFPRALQAPPDTSWKSSSSDSSSTRIITSQSSPTWNILALQENNSNALEVIVGYILFTCAVSEKREPSPNNLKLKVPLVLFPWERESWLLVFGDTTDTAAARRAMIRPPVTMQQQGQGSGRQKYKKCILLYSGWSHIVKASDIFTDICRHQQMIIYKKHPWLLQWWSGHQSLCQHQGHQSAAHKCISKQVFNFAATQTGIENIHNLLSYPFK